DRPHARCAAPCVPSRQKTRDSTKYRSRRDRPPLLPRGRGTLGTCATIFRAVQFDCAMPVQSSACLFSGPANMRDVQETLVVWTRVFGVLLILVGLTLLASPEIRYTKRK